ncbi:cytochrome oxidase assembly protein [Rickettsiella grylli]|uniref:Cytochrome oxidase assembly protein n=2 Tax=Rickettsiella grylli TaxID=59196 RepID=A8PL71_9COXI|nr:cytochrome oxidase assembly protein [Rickettsiella grylli]
MLLRNKSALHFLYIAFLFAFIVIQLGVYTRLKDAGLGCPDWPTCYGRFIVPTHTLQLHHAPFINQILSAEKAWPEMIHRYAAASLVLFSFAAIILIVSNDKRSEQPLKIAISLFFLLLLQGLLGKWTVTLKLHPLVVMSHLLGGFASFSVLWLLILQLNKLHINQISRSEQKLKPWAALGLLLIILQISLGGWTSANYAAFVCPDFPTCQGVWWPRMNFSEGFHLWMNTAINFEGGILSSTARTAIQMAHRLMAILTGLYLSWIVYTLWRTSKKKFFRALAILLGLLLALQIGLGILNIVWLLALPIALSHNAVAALLLLVLITLNVSLYSNQHSFDELKQR